MQNLREKIEKQLGTPLPETFEFNGTFKHWRSDGNASKSPHFWAVGYTWQYKGNENQTVIYGSFREDNRFQDSSYDLKGQTKPFQAAHNAAVEKINKAAAEEKEQRHKTCVQKWEPIYLDAPISDSHPYLLKKQIKPGRTGVDRHGNLIVPIQDINGVFSGVQIIKNDNSKMFATGTKIQGHFYSTHQDLTHVNLIYLCEGFATGMSIYQATNTPVVCAMNCGNLLNVATKLREINPELRIILCADDDREAKVNSGKKKAEEVARKLNNVVVKFPKFTVHNSKFTDFNDLHVNEGIETLIEQLTFTSSDFVDIIPYGHEGKNFYYYSTHTLKLEHFSASEHNKHQLLSMAKGAYWSQKFPQAVTETGLDYTKVAEELFELQRNKGHFNPSDVRGTGAWIDQGRPVYNLGKFILDAGKQIPIQNFHANSKFLYEASSVQNFDPDQQAEPHEITRLIECFKLLPYKEKEDYIYLVGWIVCAHACGSLDWRPHIWLTGPKASGKSTVLSMTSALLNSVPIDRGTTEAGVRQKLKINSRAVIYDEAEPNNKKDRARMDGLMELIRQSSSRTDNGHIVKGSSGGQAQVFKINSCFLLASIQTSLEISADQSRFTVIEMIDTKTQPRHVYAKIVELSTGFDLLGPKLAALCASNLTQIHERIKLAAHYMTQHQTFHEQRKIDQHSALVGAFSWLSGTPIEQCVPAPQTAQDNADELTDDADECLATLMQISNREGRNIAQLLEAKKHEDLAVFGIRIVDQETFFVSSTNINIRDNMVRLSRFKDYAALLKRSARFVDVAQLRVSGERCRGVLVRFDHEEAPF